MRTLVVGLLVLLPAIVLAENIRVRGVSITGERVFRQEELRRIIGIRTGELFEPDLCERAKARVRRRYEGAGYPRVELTCELANFYEGTSRADVLFRIREGEPDRINGVAIEGEIPESLQKELSNLSEEVKGSPYSATIGRELLKQFLLRARLGGYLFAGGSESFQDGEFRVNLVLRDKVELQFVGNKHLPTERLLAAMELEKRFSPFTRRSLIGFQELIVREYEAAGFFFARVELEKTDGVERYTYWIHEGPRTELQEVRILGNSAIPEEEIRKIVKLKPKKFWDFDSTLLSRSAVASDLLAIEDFYRSRGYADARAEVLPLDECAEVVLQIRILEGEQQRVRDVVEEGACAGVESEFRALKGEVVSDALVRGKKRSFEKALHRAGYAQSAVEVLYQPKERVLRVSVACGDRTQIRSVQIQGLEHTSESFVRTLIGNLEGEALNEELLDEKISRLRQTGLFSSVKFLPLDGVIDSPSEELVLRVVERDTGVLDGSLSFNTEDGLRFGGELSQRNIGGNGQTIALLADLFLNDGPSLFDAGRARAFHRLPRLFEEDALELLTEGYFQYDIQTLNQFNFRRVGVDSQLRYRSESFLFSGGVSVFRDDVTELLPDVLLTPRDIDSTLFGYLVARVEYDARDSSLLPTDGFYGAISGKLSNESFLSDVSLASVAGEFRHYLPLEPLVWANSVRGIVIEPYGDTDVVPMSQRLFLGGASTVRGFGRNRLSPLGVEGGRAGGDLDYILNTELQLNLPSDVQLGLFVDAGEVRIRNGGESLQSRSSDFRISPGFGIRYRSPIGPIGVDFGVPVEKRTGESSPRIYVGFNGVF